MCMYLTNFAFSHPPGPPPPCICTFLSLTNRLVEHFRHKMKFQLVCWLYATYNLRGQTNEATTYPSKRTRNRQSTDHKHQVSFLIPQQFQHCFIESVLTASERLTLYVVDRGTEDVTLKTDPLIRKLLLLIHTQWKKKTSWVTILMNSRSVLHKITKRIKSFKFLIFLVSLSSPSTSFSISSTLAYLIHFPFSVFNPSFLIGLLSPPYIIFTYYHDLTNQMEFKNSSQVPMTSTLLQRSKRHSSGSIKSNVLFNSTKQNQIMKTVSTTQKTKFFSQKQNHHHSIRFTLSCLKLRLTLQ